MVKKCVLQIQTQETKSYENLDGCGQTVELLVWMEIQIWWPNVQPSSNISSLPDSETLLNHTIRRIKSLISYHLPSEPKFIGKNPRGKPDDVLMRSAVSMIR